MITKADRTIAALVMILSLVGFALIFAGVWIKSGPELAMIVAGVMIFWFVSMVTRPD